MTRKLEKILVGLGAVGVGASWVSRWVLNNPSEYSEYIVGSALVGGILALVGYGVYYKNERKESKEKMNQIEQEYKERIAKIDEEIQLGTAKIREERRVYDELYARVEEANRALLSQLESSEGSSREPQSK